MSRQSIDLPDEVKSDLEKMSKGIGMMRKGLAYPSWVERLFLCG